MRFFALAGEDLAFVRQQRGAANQLGVGLQLGALRWLGFVPDDLAGAPPDAVAVLAETLDVAPRVIFDYAVRAHAGLRAFSELELERLQKRLVAAALEHERPTLLLVRVCEVLRAEQIERPSIDRLVRPVGWARERAHEVTYHRLKPQLTDTIRRTLDGLLAADGAKSRHAWLRARPTTVSAGAMRREVEKRAFLIQTIGADQFDLSGGPPNRRAWHAQTGRQSTNQALARMAPERRYLVLVCFCAEALERVTDDALEVYDRALGAADRAAQRKRDEKELRTRRDTQTTVRRFVDLAQALLEARDENTDVLRLIDRRIGLDRLREDLGRAERILPPHTAGHLDILIDSGASGRKLLSGILAGVELKRSGVDDDEMLAALRLISEIAGSTRRWLPGFSPSAFSDKAWRAYVVDISCGRLDRRAYELCAAYEPRSALRAGRVWVPAAVGTPTRQACSCPTSTGRSRGLRSSRRSTDPSTARSGCGRWQTNRLS